MWIHYATRVTTDSTTFCPSCCNLFRLAISWFDSSSFWKRSGFCPAFPSPTEKTNTPTATLKQHTTANSQGQHTQPNTTKHNTRQTNRRSNKQATKRSTKQSITMPNNTATWNTRLRSVNLRKDQFTAGLVSKSLGTLDFSSNNSLALLGVDSDEIGQGLAKLAKFGEIGQGLAQLAKVWRDWLSSAKVRRKFGEIGEVWRWPMYFEPWEWR